VCYNRGGQTDFLTAGETGNVIALNDINALTQAIVALHSDSQSRAKFGRHNRELVENYFIDSCAARYESIFEEVIARAAGSPSQELGVRS
jgi:glycosyltransferase involved in cell wall biosynthesis